MRGEYIFMRIGICDNDIQYIQWLIGLLRQIREVGDSEIISYCEPSWLVDDIESHKAFFDFVIINREVKNNSGVDAALRIYKADNHCRIILLSDANIVEEDLYQLPCGVFLPKQHVPLHLITVVKNIISSLEKQTATYFIITSNRERIVIPCSKVLYMERILRKTMVVMEHNSIETYQSPRELLEQSGTLDFAQCHRSIFINMRRIFSISASHIRLQNSYVFPIGNTYSDQFQEEFKTFCRRTIRQNSTD